MEKEIKIEVHKTIQKHREMEIEFPLYVKRAYPEYPGITYIEYNGEDEYRSFNAITIPIDSQDKYAMSYYCIEDKCHFEQGYLYALRECNIEDKEYYELSNKEEYLAALELYKINFLNKI